MATVQTGYTATRGKALRRQRDGDAPAGSGLENHVLTGTPGSTGNNYVYKSIVDFGVIDWSPMAKIIKIELALKVEANSTHYTYGSAPRIRIQLLKAAFANGNSPEGVWDPTEWQVPSLYASSAYLTIPLDYSTTPPRAPDEQFVYADVTAICGPIVGKNTHMPDGSVGLGYTTNGFYIRAPDDEKALNQRAVFRSYHDGVVANRPKLVITYESVNAAPTAPTGLGPTGDVSWAAVFTGRHQDPDGDPMAGREVTVWKAGTPVGGTPVWTLGATAQAASSEETQTGVFSVPLSLATGALFLGTAYVWAARTKDSRGAVGVYSAQTPFKITSSAPSVVVTDVGSISAMSGTLFGGAYSDPESNPMDRYHIQMGPVGVDWTDPAAVVWDTGEDAPTASEVTAKKIAREYAGRALAAATYVYRIQVRDNTGVWSAWSQDTFTLIAPYNPDFGETLPVTQIDRKPTVRIALYSVYVDPSIAKPVVVTGRGRGALIGYIDDATDLGASKYLNGAGELYFSLPALHPYCPSIEPFKVHYAVEQWYGDRYRPLFHGLITDFDADSDTVTFYGTDYLGLLQTAVDERYDPNQPEKAASGSGGGGSKYIDKTIDYILKDQLAYHRGQANSPVTFISVAPVARFDALPERATIFATYSQCLPFIVGLLDSHKQGTGKQVRFYVRPTDNTFTAFEFSLKDNWGVDRPDIRLEWGQIITDFRVVALGDFGTRVLGVGQKRGEVKVYRAVGTATGMNEADWGRRAQTRFYQDIIDQNDLQRRVNEDAAQLAKVGKRIALAFKVDALTPFDGWDVGDNIVIDIRRGVVYTLGYGSGGYWTILGVEWRFSPDGHTDMTLTFSPKQTGTGAPSDLIPSVNPGLSVEWQVGHGIPSSYGVPPVKP
jgi:hypothetical protein